MPNFHYRFHNPGNCAAGAGNPLTLVPNPVAITWPQLINAQLRLGVYPVGWVLDEINWRIYSFLIGFQQAAGVGVFPVVPPVVAVAQVPLPPAGGAANLPPSPVAAGVDSTEKGQIGYHLGTAVGGHLATYMATGGAARNWYAFHLSRAEANGGQFLCVGGRPDIVAFSINPGTGNWYEFVVWENKGHCVNAGGFGAIWPALQQAQCLQNCNIFPAGLPFPAGPAGPGGPWLPDSYIASFVDVYHGNFRVQVIDPPRTPRPPQKIGSREMDGFLRGYYAPFVEALSKNYIKRTYDGRAFQTVLLPKQIRLGLDANIFAAIQSRGSTDGLAAAVAKATTAGYANKSPGTVYVDPTGISIELPTNWEQQLRRRGEPSFGRRMEMPME